MTASEGAARPYAIVAFLGTQVLGDFIEYHLLAASIAQSVRNGRLLVMYRDDRPYKNFVTALNPWATASLKVPEDPNQVIPLDWFDGRVGVPGRPFDEGWYAAGFHKPDLLLTPSIMGLHLSRRLGSPPAFRIPDKFERPLAQALVTAGVAPDRWFACVHMREAGYAFRRNVSNIRCVDPADYIAMITHIIRGQGGQVVRLGDPSMTSLPVQDGLVDLSRADGTFPLQAYALSRARYFVGTASGPLALGCAFKVPTATTNAIHASIWNDGNAVLPKRNIRLAGGPVIEGRAFIEALDHVPAFPRAGSFDNNTPEELCLVADHMHDKTQDCTGWRQPVAEPDIASGATSVTLPLPRRRILEGYEIDWL